MNIKEYLNNRILITDGAMGTYYSQITGNYTQFSETANLNDSLTIKKIHLEYLKAGAQLIRTNTFSANIYSMNITPEEVDELICAGVKIAKEAVKEYGGEEIYIGASIGPIPETNRRESIDSKGILEEYKRVVDSFIKNGIGIFIFETFSSVENLKEITEYIKGKNENAYILTQFALMANGYTRKEKSFNKIAEEVMRIKTIDSFGFNCGTGPKHIYNNIKSISFESKVVSVLPNAGFPEIVNERTVYNHNPDYFADMMAEFVKIGVKIVGGCCGTTPLHIKKLTQRISTRTEKIEIIQSKCENEKKLEVIENSFITKLRAGKFVNAVELDPPFGFEIDKLISGAKILKDNGIDIITIADSPLGKVRMNSIITAAKIKRDVGIDVMPHIACRDRNIIALKSDVLAAYMENIRNLLLVTGDPIPSSEKNEIKSVFNLNSIKLMEFIKDVSLDKFSHDPVAIGGALNLNVLNRDVEIERMKKKIEAGAEYFLTQPLFNDESIEYVKSMKKFGAKILGGILPLVSYKNAMFIANEMPGITIPEKYINMFDDKMSREDAETIGINISVEIASKIKEYVDGFYFITPFNRVNMIVKIIERIK